VTKRLLATALLTIITVGAWADVQACGDKFLVPTRGTRFQRPPDMREPAAILVFANSAIVPASVANAAIDAMLRKAGYRPTSVNNVSDFDKALDRGKWDLVLVDLADGPSVSSRLQGVSAPVLLPVAQNMSSSQLTEARKHYARVVAMPVKSRALIDVVDDALAQRRESQARAGGKAGR
jgi:DNA-binding NtrC family response regulator